MGAAIRVEGVSKKYRVPTPETAGARLFVDELAKLARWRPGRSSARADEFWALKDVSFDVPAGQVTGVIGRNGAGKSTLLKILSRITRPTSGQVRLRGRVGSLLEVGTGFHAELTGRENIYLSGAVLGMRRAEIRRKFDEIVAFAEVERFLDTPVKRYSSGMYMRLAFAVAAHLEPETLIVDEVLAVGDAAFQRKCMGKMGDVAAGGRTVLFVSHDMGVVRRICQTAVCLDSGAIVARGPAEEAVEQFMATSTPDATKRLPLHGSQSTLEVVELVDATGRPAASVVSGQPWGLRVIYSLNTALPVGISFRLLDARGGVVFDIHECVGGVPARSAGRYATEYRFTAPDLTPGDYRLNVYIMAHCGISDLVAADLITIPVIGLSAEGTRAFDIGGVVVAHACISTVATA